MKMAYPISRKKMYTVLFVANVCLSIFRYILVPQASDSFHLVASVASLLGFWGLWEFILWLGEVLEKKFPVALHPNKRIIIQILATFTLATVIGEILFKVSVDILHAPLPLELKKFGYLLYFMLSIVMNLIFFGTIYFFNWKKDLLKLANAQREEATVKYDALRNQLNPHFLFNALTSLNSLIFENQQLASDYLQHLSKVFRYILQHKEKETVTVATEINFIGNYTYLLKTRFADAIEINVDVGEDALGKEIVPVTLQILIENAVKHNIISLREPLKISIKSMNATLIVENTINRKSLVETSNKQGLNNLKALYRYLVSWPVEVNEHENVFSVKIPLI